MQANKRFDVDGYCPVFRGDALDVLETAEETLSQSTPESKNPSPQHPHSK